ncbi:unnamed protein product [Prunus armeniaca]
MIWGKKGRRRRSRRKRGRGKYQSTSSSWNLAMAREGLGLTLFTGIVSALAKSKFHFQQLPWQGGIFKFNALVVFL